MNWFAARQMVEALDAAASSPASSNAANYFSNGIKGRPDEAKFADGPAQRRLTTVA